MESVAQRSAQQGSTELSHVPRSTVQSDENHHSPVQMSKTVCYPATAPSLSLVDSQQKHPILEYRTATFTHLQVAQATFCYPPTPPVEIPEPYHQQPGETQALSHIGYGGATGTDMDYMDPGSSAKTPPFSSGLPTPPHLIPISTDEPSTNVCSASPLSSSNTSKDSAFFNKWSPAEHGYHAPLSQDCSSETWSTDMATSHLNNTAIAVPPSNTMFFPVSHSAEGEPYSYLTPSLFT